MGVSACIIFGAGISQLIEHRVLKFRDRKFPSRSQDLAPPTLRTAPREQPTLEPRAQGRATRAGA